MINKTDYYYILCILLNILIIYIINDKINLIKNRYIDFLFYIMIILLNEYDIKFSILVSFVYIVLKIKQKKIH
jgi:hypothetical protein